MGDDLRVVNAARVSFDKQSNELSEKDIKLISYLAKHNHWTPFSQVEIQMRETVPIFVARQRFKHTVGFTYNEVSRRYVDDTPEFYYPVAWRKASENKKQGSSDETVDYWEVQVHDDPFPMFENVYPVEIYREFVEYAKDIYESFIEKGIAPEQARMVLPQSMYTSYYVKGSLAAWARAYKLRSSDDAQREIQDLAKMWDDTIGKLEGMKHSWTALKGARTPEAENGKL